MIALIIVGYIALVVFICLFLKGCDLENEEGLNRPAEEALKGRMK